MNLAIWILQGLLAVVMLGAGAFKLFTPKTKIEANPQTGWAREYSEAQVKLIGLAELLGAIGLVVPWKTAIAPILTPLAALCLAVLMVGAAVVHRRRHEPVLPPVVFVVLLLVVAAARFAQLGGAV